MTLKDNLIAARALIATPDHWCKGTLKMGCAFCAMGAIGEVVTDIWVSGTPEYAALRAELPWGKSVPSFNDADSTKHEDVLALFDLAIEAAT